METAGQSPRRTGEEQPCLDTDSSFSALRDSSMFFDAFHTEELQFGLQQYVLSTHVPGQKECQNT